MCCLTDIDVSYWTLGFKIAQSPVTNIWRRQASLSEVACFYCRLCQYLRNSTALFYLRWITRQILVLLIMIKLSPPPLAHELTSHAYQIYCRSNEPWSRVLHSMARIRSEQLLTQALLWQKEPARASKALYKGIWNEIVILALRWFFMAQGCLE